MTDKASAPSKFILNLLDSSRNSCSMTYSQRIHDIISERKFSKYHLQVSWLTYNDPFIEYTNIIQHAFNKTYEEEFEEQGKVVPYKVELADAVSQQR